MLPIVRENGACGRKGARALLCTLSTRMGCRARSLLEPLLERGLLPRGRTTRPSSGVLLPSWGLRLPLGRAVGHPVTLLPAVPAVATGLQIARASTRSLSAWPYYCSIFLLGTTHLRESTFWTKLNAAKLVGLLNSRPTLRRFARDRVHELRVLLPAPLHVGGSSDLSSEFCWV